MRNRIRIQEEEVRIPSGKVSLGGSLTVPADTAEGIVVFAHGSGSSRFSPRNRFIARTLNEAGLATLLFDLLTREEEEVDLVTRGLRFDIAMLSTRLTDVVDWVAAEPAACDLQIGLFGSSTGAAAALLTAAERPELIHAVVSRGGRPDLAGDALMRVKAPVLLLVGGEDKPVIEMNRDAARFLQGEYKIRIIPGATHLFEEPGTLEEVGRLAGQWFIEHLTRIGQLHGRE